LRASTRRFLSASKNFLKPGQLAEIQLAVNQEKADWLENYASTEIEQSLQKLKASIVKNSPPPPDFTAEYTRLSKLVEGFTSEYLHGFDLTAKLLALKDSATQAHWLSSAD
jgi:hypothetical protein